MDGLGTSGKVIFESTAMHSLHFMVNLSVLSGCEPHSWWSVWSADGRKGSPGYDTGDNTVTITDVTEPSASEAA